MILVSSRTGKKGHKASESEEEVPYPSYEVTPVVDLGGEVSCLFVLFFQQSASKVLRWLRHDIIVIYILLYIFYIE